MGRLEISGDLQARLDHFRQVAEVILEKKIDLREQLEITIARGLDAMLEDLLAAVEPDVLMTSFKQLAARNPEAVYTYVAEMLRQGTIADAREKFARRLGFQPKPRHE
jgi:hypothetical protein